MAGGWFYLMTNRRNGILYAGVTSSLPRRIYDDRSDLQPPLRPRRLRAYTR